MREQDIFLYLCRTAGAQARTQSHIYLERAVSHYRQMTGPEPGRNERAWEDAHKETQVAEVSAWTLEKGPHGKPRFAQAPEICFSISHSGAFWTCAVCGAPIGIDLQEKKRKKDPNAENAPYHHARRIAGRYFHPMEQQFLDAGGDFFDIWAAKESYVKYTGNGIGADFGHFSVSDGKSLLDRVRTAGGDGPYLRRLSFETLLQNEGKEAPEHDAAYSLCLCADGFGEIRCIWL